MPDERKATVTYEATDSTLTYPFAFDYLRKEFIKVKYTDPGKVNVKLDYSTDYDVSESHITLHQSPPVGSMLTIYRETPTSKIVSWNDGSILRASDMSVQDVQVLHILEENEDILMFNALHYNEELHTWDGKDRRLSNLADPEGAQDAVTKSYLEAEEGSFKALAEALVAQAEHQAIISGQQATIATTQATKSEEKANIATEQAEIAIQNATTATGEARAAIAASHYAESEANKAHEAKQEATLKAQTAAEQAAIATTAAATLTNTLEKVTKQADRAEAGVTTTIKYAEIATEQANRAEKEADRAKLMADRSDTTEHNTGTTSHAAGIAGNAATATKLQTARTISLIGDVAGSGIFDGSGDLSIETVSNANAYKPNTRYAAGDIVSSPLLPSWACLECIQAGTAGDSLTLKINAIAELITDGTLVWAVRHIGELHNTGDIWLTNATFNEEGFLIHGLTGLAMLDVHICDGMHGTPDMRNAFVMGADVSGIGTKGGANDRTLTTAQMPSHTHIATAATDAQGGHAHSMTANENTSLRDQPSTWDVVMSCKVRCRSAGTDTSGAHSHKVTTTISSVGGGQAFDNRPAFVALAYVQKIY